MPDSLTVRLDKWLWAARFFRTRTLAAAAIEAGRVRIDGARVKPARPVRIDDLIRMTIGGFDWEVRVRRLSDVRASAGIAQTLYAETGASMAARAAAIERGRLEREPALQRKGRPSKRDRRQIESLGTTLHDDERDS